MNDDDSLSDEATFAEEAARRPPADVSLGDERTRGGGDAAGPETLIDDNEVVDLEARYRVDATLGRGGMGAVLLATDTRLDRRVAIKRILGEAAGSGAAVQRFLAEAKAIAALNHPNIVQIHDYGQATDGPFLIMEYVDGGSLLDRCRDTALPLDEAIGLACHICDGLAKAHDLGIIHRDIKPANVLLTRDGIPKLTDFGLAKSAANDLGQTVTGAVFGTPDFMSPEQRRDAGEVDHRSDLWSLAATVYQMVTGRSPKVIRLHELPEGLQGVMARALEDAQEVRYQSARELRDALKAALRSPALATAAVAVGECRCPSCGIPNDPARKFCRGCGESLAAACLACNAEMPTWEEICGSCGAKQTLLADQRAREMAAAQARAEGLLGDFDFEGATATARRLRDEPHPRLRHLRRWAESFLLEVEKARAQQINSAAESFDEATAHERAHDYLSAILVLEGVPESLRATVLPGRFWAVGDALRRVKEKQAEVRRLDAVVTARLGSKAFEGLLPDVERLLELKPERKDLHRVRQQLTDRLMRKTVARDTTLQAARASLARHDYEHAVRSLAQISGDVVTPDVIRLRHEAEHAAKMLRELMKRIRTALADDRLDGLLKTVDDALRLKPGDTDLVRLRRRLEAHEHQCVEEAAAAVASAAAMERSGRYAEAAELLYRVPEPRRSPAVAASLGTYRERAERRASLLGSFETSDRRTLDAAIAAGRDYLRDLTDAGIKDSEYAGRLREAELRLARSNLAKSVSSLARHVTSWVAAVAAAAATGLLIYGVWCWGSGERRAPVRENGLGMRLASIPAGELVQRIVKTIAGADEPRFIGRKTSIPHPFSIGVTEVTQAQWLKVMESAPWRGQPDAIDGPQQPATYIVRGDAQKFCDRLTELERAVGAIDASVEYRLPSEEEWEYACRAGSNAVYQFGDDVTAVERYEWCASNGRAAAGDHPHDVAQKKTTKWGLYDAFGNVREICSNHVRGACWIDPPERCAIARANTPPPRDGNQFTGFRVILAPKRTQ